MLKMTIDNEEVVSDKDITINEEMLSASSTILNNVYPKEWEEDKDYTSRFYYPQDYSKALIQRSYVTQEAEAGTTIQVNGSVTLTDVDTTKNSRVLRLLGQTSQTGTPTPSSPIPVNVVSGDNEINVVGKNLLRYDLTHLKDKNTTGTWNNNVYTSNGLTITINKDLSIKINGTSTAQETFFINNEKIYFETGAYYLSGSVNGSNTTYDIRVYNFNGSSIAFQCLTGAKEVPFVNNNQFFNVAIVVRNGQTLNNVVFYPMIAKTNDTTYEPYQGNTYNIDLPEGMELCKIGTYQDYIYKDSDKWYLHKEIGKYNIDTSTLGIKTNYTNIEYATIPKPNNYLGYGSFDKVEIICKSASHIAQAPSGWNDANLVNKISGNPEANRWWLGFSKGTGITAIRNALNGSYIYYPLTTPTNTEITYEPLIEQLNALSSQ